MNLAFLKRNRKFLFFSFLFWASSLVVAQGKVEDTEEVVHFDCGITQTKQKLKRHFFASTPPTQLRINNEGFAYTTLQFGKRKRKMYLYLRILEDNVCIKKEKNVDIYFKTGEIITLKNEHPLNCDSFFARQLRRKEIKKIFENEITLIKIYTYKKNYEHYVSDAQSINIHNYLTCLRGYKIKKSSEVKVKKHKESQKNSHQQPTE